jgi:aspartate/tyrosine/aromatic aminotransferase
MLDLGRLITGLLCRQVIRAMYSSPPRHGAEIAELVLSDPQLFQEWKVRCSAIPV